MKYESLEQKQTDQAAVNTKATSSGSTELIRRSNASRSTTVENGHEMVTGQVEEQNQLAIKELAVKIKDLDLNAGENQMEAQDDRITTSSEEIDHLGKRSTSKATTPTEKHLTREKPVPRTQEQSQQLRQKDQEQATEFRRTGWIEKTSRLEKDIQTRDATIARTNAIQDDLALRLANQMDEISSKNYEIEERDRELEWSKKKIGEQDVELENVCLTMKEMEETLRNTRKKVDKLQIELDNVDPTHNIRPIFHRLLHTRLFQSPRPIYHAPQEQPFPFLKLPEEIRAQVYSHLLTSPRPIDFWPVKPTPSHLFSIPTRSKSVSSSIRPLHPSVLLACRKIQEEATPILYANNHFCFTDRGGWTILVAFLTHIGQNARFLTRISVSWPGSMSYRRTGDECPPGNMRNPSEWKECFQEFNTVLSRFGTSMQDFAGPPVEPLVAEKMARRILIRLPELRILRFILPHDVEVRTWTIGEFLRFIKGPDADHKAVYGASWEKMTEVGVVVLQKEEARRVGDGHGWGMERSELRRQCENAHVAVRNGQYRVLDEGDDEERLGWVVEGDDDEEQGMEVGKTKKKSMRVRVREVVYIVCSCVVLVVVLVVGLSLLLAGMGWLTWILHRILLFLLRPIVGPF